MTLGNAYKLDLLQLDNIPEKNAMLNIILQRIKKNLNFITEISMKFPYLDK